MYSLITNSSSKMTHSEEYKLAAFIALNQNIDVYDLVTRELCNMYISKVHAKNLQCLIQKRGKTKIRDIKRYCKNIFSRNISQLKKHQLIEVIHRFDIPYDNMKSIDTDMNKKRCLHKIQEKKIVYSDDMNSFGFEIYDGIIQTLVRGGIYGNIKIEFITYDMLIVRNIETTHPEIMTIYDFIDKTFFTS